MSTTERGPFPSFLSLVEDGTEGRAERPFLAFTVGERRYAVDMGRAREILRARRPTRLPRTPSFVEGVISVRGAVVPLVDLAGRLGVGSPAAGRGERFLVVAGSNGDLAALRVDSVLGVVRLPGAALEVPQRSEPMVAVITVGGEPCRVLDLDAVLDWRGLV
jgi:purine-binding chemotaxis protein CheW